LTTREVPGGDPPSAATPAQVVDELRVAHARELTRVQVLAERLAQEQTHAEKVTLSLERTREQIAARVKAAASEGFDARPVTAHRLSELGRELRQERELEQESYLVQAQVQTSSHALEQAQVRLQQLERVLALAMVQARTLAREQAQAQARLRSLRLRTLVLGRFLWRLMQARQGLWAGIVRSLYLGMRVVRLVVWMLPTADRDRWESESFNELEELKEEGVPLLGNAVRMALRTPLLALVLRTNTWRRSPTAGSLPRLRPLWIGLATAAATLLGGIAGIGPSPTEFQARLLVVASLLSGILATSGSYKGRRPRRRRRKRR
jgi:hypothetical protein